MQYVDFIIALGIVMLFGVWSGRRHRKSFKAQGEKVHPLRKSKRTNHLRRVK